MNLKIDDLSMEVLRLAYRNLEIVKAEAARQEQVIRQFLYREAQAKGIDPELHRFDPSVGTFVPINPITKGRKKTGT